MECKNNILVMISSNKKHVFNEQGRNDLNCCVKWTKDLSPDLHDEGLVIRMKQYSHISPTVGQFYRIYHVLPQQILLLSLERKLSEP